MNENDISVLKKAAAYANKRNINKSENKNLAIRWFNDYCKDRKIDNKITLDNIVINDNNYIFSITDVQNNLKLLI